MKTFIKKIFIFLGLFLLSAVLILSVDYFILGNQHLGNYQASILDKTARYRSLTGPKIVLIGNSNLAFGMDSEMLSEATGMEVVNMGLHGGLGSAFNENMVKLGELNEGDIVILSLHTYADDDSIEDPSLALITVEKHRDLWKLIRLRDLYGIAKAYPDYFKDCIMYKCTSEDDNTPEETTCYSRSAFNEYGDNIRRLEGDDNFVFYPGSIEVPTVNDICVNRINSLNGYVESRGAALLIAGYPIGYGEFTPDASEYDKFERVLRERMDCDVISHFTDYFIPYELFYDTKYHLDEEGARVRTSQLIKDLERWMEERNG
jgi:hypothetical protein